MDPETRRAMEEFATIAGRMKGQWQQQTGGSGSNFERRGFGLRISSQLPRLATILAVIVIMQLLHNRSLNKITARYGTLMYETSTVHPYNHCIETISRRMAESGSKIEVDKIERLCSPLDLPVKADSNKQRDKGTEKGQGEAQ